VRRSRTLVLQRPGRLQCTRALRAPTKSVRQDGGNLRAMADDDHDDVKHSIRMTTDRLLVRPSDEIGERKSRAGILIPATANVDRRLVWAEVVAVGPTVRNVEEGDRVLFAPDSGYEVEIRADQYLILRERDVHAVASVRADGQTGLYL
jgi:chaperonin GroES